jgi:tetratricopeptide (TPR) repeat protein
MPTTFLSTLATGSPVAFALAVSILRRMPSRFACSIAFLVLVWCSTGCRTVRHDVNRGLTTNGEPVRVDHEAAEKRAEAHAQFMAGLSYDQSGEPERATAAYEKSLSNDPANEGLAVDLSRRYLQQKQYDKAIEVLKRAAESAQGSGLMFARLSLVYLQQGNTNAAIEASRAAIKREPSSIAGYQSLFHLHRALNQTNEAQKVIEQAAKQPKPDAPFLIDLAQMYLALDAESPLATNSPSRLRASELLKRASSMENTNLLSLQRLAQGFLFVGESKRAAEVYRKMLAEDPELVGVREALAELYLRSNDTKQAGEILKEIVRDTPTNPQAYYFLGAIAYEESWTTTGRRCSSAWIASRFTSTFRRRTSP